MSRPRKSRRRAPPPARAAPADRPQFISRLNADTDPRSPGPQLTRPQHPLGACPVLPPPPHLTGPLSSLLPVGPAPAAARPGSIIRWWHCLAQGPSRAVPPGRCGGNSSVRTLLLGPPSPGPCIWASGDLGTPRARPPESRARCHSNAPVPALPPAGSSPTFWKVAGVNASPPPPPPSDLLSLPGPFPYVFCSR